MLQHTMNKYQYLLVHKSAINMLIYTVTQYRSVNYISVLTEIISCSTY
jgi:hypothetical protein